MKVSATEPFTSIIADKGHRLNKLLHAVSINPYSSRENKRFAIPKWRTNRFYILLLKEQRFINYGRILYLGFKGVLCIFSFIHLALSAESL